MATTCTFNAIPETVVTGGSVRFFPVVEGNTYPITGDADDDAYYWEFEDDSSTSTDPSPIHVYATAGTWNVKLTVCESDGTETSCTLTDYITVVDAGDIPDIAKTGYSTIGVFIYDGTNAMFVSRNASSICSLYLLNPVICDTIDKSPTTTFQILDLGDTAVPTNARSLIAEGKCVVAIQGKSVVFSGIIRRASQNTQSGFSFSTHLKLWDIECDSDLMRLAKMNVPTSALTTDGSPIIDSPGYIARRILEPAAGEADWRGVIYCQDSAISFQLNSTDLEDVGSQYDQMMTLRDVTNYDLITRRDWTTYLYYTYVPTTATSGVVTIIESFTVDDPNLIGGYVLFIIPPAPGSPPTSLNIIGYGTIIDNTETTLTLDPVVGGDSIDTFLGYMILLKYPKIDFAPDLGTPSEVVSLDVNSDVFEYTDNDDKRKLSTKVIVKGKDLQGKTISVGLVACHGYNNTKQFFKDSTFITKKSEGYVYKNNISAPQKGVTFKSPSGSLEITVDSEEIWIHNLSTGAVSDHFPLHVRAQFFVDGSGVLPTGYSLSTDYWISEISGADIAVSGSYGGSSIVHGSTLTAICYISSFGGVVIDNSDSYLAMHDPIQFIATSYPAGVSPGVTYYVVSPIGITTTETFEFSLTPSGSPVALTHGSVGADVKIVKVGTSGGGTLVSESPTVWLYGWGYAIPTGSTVALSIPGVSAVAATTTGAPVESTDGSGVQYTAITLTEWLTTDYSSRGFFLNKRLYVNEDLGWV